MSKEHKHAHEHEHAHTHTSTQRERANERERQRERQEDIKSRQPFMVKDNNSLSHPLESSVWAQTVKLIPLAHPSLCKPPPQRDMIYPLLLLVNNLTSPPSTNSGHIERLVTVVSSQSHKFMVCWQPLSSQFIFHPLLIP